MQKMKNNPNDICLHKFNSLSTSALILSNCIHKIKVRKGWLNKNKI